MFGRIPVIESLCAYVCKLSAVPPPTQLLNKAMATIALDLQSRGINLIDPFAENQKQLGILEETKKVAAVAAVPDCDNFEEERFDDNKDIKCYSEEETKIPQKKYSADDTLSSQLATLAIRQLIYKQ